MFLRLEEAAGVEHIDGRVFYGLRRVATGLAADLETDDRVLSRLTGHHDSQTRERIYQNREREETEARTARSRRELWKKIEKAVEDEFA
jgi:integrase